MSRLFDIYVTPILNYSCEVWGTEPLGGALQALERVHTQFSNTCYGFQSIHGQTLFWQSLVAFL